MRPWEASAVTVTLLRPLQICNRSLLRETRYGHKNQQRSAGNAQHHPAYKNKDMSFVGCEWQHRAPPFLLF